MSVQRISRVELGSEVRHVVERDGTWRTVDGSIYGEWAPGKRLEIVGRPLAPVDPSKIVAVGLNYRHHATERNKPLSRGPMIFLKPSTAVIGPGEPIRVPAGVGRVDHEAELGVVIGDRVTVRIEGIGELTNPVAG